MDQNSLICVVTLLGTFSVIKVVQDGLNKLASKYSRRND